MSASATSGETESSNAIRSGRILDEMLRLRALSREHRPRPTTNSWPNMLVERTTAYRSRHDLLPSPEGPAYSGARSASSHASHRSPHQHHASARQEPHAYSEGSHARTYASLVAVHQHDLPGRREQRAHSTAGPPTHRHEQIPAHQPDFPTHQVPTAPPAPPASLPRPRRGRGPWTNKEDSLLLHVIRVYHTSDWVNISKKVATRSAKQCRERYYQNLMPGLNHEPITPEEGILIEQLVEKHGKKWANIAKLLNGRSDNAIKNWWNGNQNRQKRQAKRNEESLHPGSFNQASQDPTLAFRPSPALPSIERDNDMHRGQSSVPRTRPSMDQADYLQNGRREVTMQPSPQSHASHSSISSQRDSFSGSHPSVSSSGLMGYVGHASSQHDCCLSSGSAYPTQSRYSHERRPSSLSTVSSAHGDELNNFALSSQGESRHTTSTTSYWSPPLSPYSRGLPLQQFSGENSPRLALTPRSHVQPLSDGTRIPRPYSEFRSSDLHIGHTRRGSMASVPSQSESGPAQLPTAPVSLRASPEVSGYKCQKHSGRSQVSVMNLRAVMND